MITVKRQFFIYAFSGLLIYLIAHLMYQHYTMQAQTSTNQIKKNQQKQQQKQQRHLLYFTPDNHTTFIDFPWYKKAHTRPQYKPNATLLTTHLSSKERQQQETLAVQRAKKLALRRFPAEAFGGVRGTSLSPQQTNDLRAAMACWEDGTWVEDEHAYQLTHLQDPTYTCKKPRTTTYRWQPKSSCPMLNPVDIQNWCRILDGRHILIVGDLPHYQYHEVLLDAFRDQPTVCFGELNCKDHTICKRPKDTKIRYVRNDLLSTHRVFPHKEQEFVNIIEWPFVTSNVLTNYPIVILTRTSLLHDDDSTFTRRLIQTMKVIRETAPNALVIYKSSFIGHPFCNDAQTPLDRRLSDKELRRLPYGWSETKRRNAIAKAVVEAAGGLYLDAASLVDKRPDAHVGNQDCLRFCIPGPLDATVQLLYNVFLLLLSSS